MSRNNNVSHETISEKSIRLNEKLQEVSSSEKINERESNQFSLKSLSDIKNLIYSGRKSIEVDVSGFKFKIQTLKNKDNKEIVKKIISLSNEEQIIGARNYTLAMAIDSINDTPLENFYDGTDLTSSFDKKVAIIDELDENIVEILFKKYVELKKDLAKSLESENITDQIKK